MSAGTASAELPGSLRSNPRLDSWLRIDRAGFVVLMPGKVEIGQGIVTALAQIAADELDLDIARIRPAGTATGFSPNEGVTSSSLSIQDGGSAVRQACAEARAIYLELAARRLGVSQDQLTIEDGTIIGPGNARTSYWELADPALLQRAASGQVPAKPAAARRLAGRSVARLDIPDKVFARRRFVHDLQLPDMLHGRVLRPRRRGATLQSLDDSAVRRLPGFRAVVRDGNFLGVVADSEAAAETCLAALARGARWSEGWALPPAAAMADWMKRQPLETRQIDLKSSATAGVGTAVARTVKFAYSRPYIAHASLAPSCAVARWRDGQLEVWSHTQGVYNLRADMALILRLAPERIVVRHIEGAGCYGHNGADDVAMDAALLARAVEGRPLRLQWSREDELVWAPFGAAMTVEIEVDLDAAGEVLAWRHDLWSNGHVARPGRASVPTLLAASEIAQPFERFIAVDPPQANGGGSDRNAIPYYDFPAHRVVAHRLLSMPLRTSALRTLGAFANVFAIEATLDEIAALRGEDPLAFRLRHLGDARARAVLQAAARRAGWAGRQRVEGRGWGLGFGRYKNSGAYCAVVAEIYCAREVRVERLWIAVDAGEVINPDGLINQIEGGAIQAVSWTLKEAVRFDAHELLSTGWEQYPILRFSEVPAIQVEILSDPAQPGKGAGEAAHAPVAAAIGNAVFDALGVRVRDLPITRDRIAAAAS